MDSNSMTPRSHAVAKAGARHARHFERLQTPDGKPRRTSDYFGCNTFSFDLMAEKLPARDVATLKEHATTNAPLTADLADKVAAAVKDWALSRGATHYSHWFQPQTGTTAEKHDSFFSFDRTGKGVEKFSGAQLIQSEPDASSFPSGGRRSTFEARGYTAWDASSPMFLMETENGLTLCIPSVFISYSGEALDKKTPLLRSISAVSKAAVDSLKLLGHEDVRFVMATAGAEQEYFVIDEALYHLRPDLILSGRTLFGRRPPKGQQLEDHYFGSIKPRILAFMAECEQELYKLGVPVKTRHNEVAPSQCESAPIFEWANIAADHNQLTMEVFRSVAKRHDLYVLFHEKPYAEINGSGKHLNWALADSNGHNLLEPGDRPQENLRFLYFCAAAVKAVHDHGALLRMAIASPGNDFRLGANEAPPAIMSVFLGETLNEVFTRLELRQEGDLKPRDKTINLDLAKVPVIHRDNTDRNRTSPFAFTGNKFEFRAVGSSASVSLPMTVLNTAMTAALEEMNTRVRKMAASGAPTQAQVLTVVQEVIKETKRVRFEGNNYDPEWHKEAVARGLPNLRTTPEALKVLKDEKVMAVLTAHGVLTNEEAEARYNVSLERYVKIRKIELESLHELITTFVIPTGLKQQASAGESARAAREIMGTIPAGEAKSFKDLCEKVQAVYDSRDRLGAFINETNTIHNEERLGEMIAGTGMNLLDSARRAVEDLEAVVDDSIWPLPKYREMLYVM